MDGCGHSFTSKTFTLTTICNYKDCFQKFCRLHLPMSSFSNNPFIDDPTTNAHARFPDISTGSLSPPIGQSWQPQFQQQPSNVQTPTSPVYNSSQFMSSPYGQNQGYSSWPQQQTQTYTGYPQQFANTSYQTYPAQQQGPYNYNSQLASGPSYNEVSQFDPYGPSYQQNQYQSQPTAYQNNAPRPSPLPSQPSQSYSQYPPQQQQQSQLYGQQGAGPGLSNPPAGGISHPRDYIRSHKSELESWDSYTWKQLLNCFDALRDAWQARKRELESRMGGPGNAPQLGIYGPSGTGYDINGVQQLIKQATLNIDSVVASSFQMHEVLEGYRQSGDSASKRRVRESSNAALSGLPDWPGLW